MLAEVEEEPTEVAVILAVLVEVEQAEIQERVLGMQEQ
jgi:hypothetical protein